VIPVFEHERRFLVADRAIVAGHTGNVIVQAYLFAVDGFALRVRRIHVVPERGSDRVDEGSAVLTAKGPRHADSREEYEWELPVPFATELIRRATHKVSKTRYQIVDGDRLWDVDEFHGDNEGLMIAECEGHNLAALRPPMWCGHEVTSDHSYDNENLAQQPFKTWK